ncbi:MAG TPA: Clp protease N-terminal domain-containing protein [Solirubrobacteraceae bacterium]|nr:Clp protease N-terminal domain-containing protein [Solirubrobacteraceae bacterium]
MFERFTEEARQVVVLAQQESRTLKHNYIGTEHLLLGLLREENGLAAQALTSLDITIDAVRDQVARIVGLGNDVASGQIPFTPRSKKVLELSLQEALSLGHNFIGTEHILLGLLRENEGVAARVLVDFGADAERVRNEVIRLISAGGGSEAERGRRLKVSVSGAVDAPSGVWPARFWSTINPVGFEIRRDLGREADSGDLLAALTCMPGSVAGRALKELGLSDADFIAAITDARAKRQGEALEQEPDLIRAIAIVRERRGRATRDGDAAIAAGLGDVERRLQHLAGDRAGGDWRVDMPRLRERLGLSRDDPPASGSAPAPAPGPAPPGP